MQKNVKDQEEILKKIGIKELNPMQREAYKVIGSADNTVLLSPTGTGKTIGFLLPLLNGLDREASGVQALILVPSRELAIQIEQVTREMGSGYKANAVYGGRPFSKDKIELSHPPAILIGTPGRIADHLRRETISTNGIRFLVLDEFDKSLEIGFEEEMKEILESLPSIQKRILTSATQQSSIPEFTGVINPSTVNFLKEENSRLEVKTIVSTDRDKLESLHKLIGYTGNGSGIVFCNFKESIQEISAFLSGKKISHGIFNGGMDQKDRERALIKFRNGTHRLIIATDLAARGLDIPAIDFIIHYELPLKSQEFIHRNGRTARMQESGTAYVLRWEKEKLPEFISEDSYWQEFDELPVQRSAENTYWETLFLSGGRRDKISKGDIAGLFLKQGNLQKEELGNIELKQDCAFVSVPGKKAANLTSRLNDSRLKKKKIRVYQI